MHRLATVHPRDNQPTTNDVTTQPISISASFIIIIIIQHLYSAIMSYADTEAQSEALKIGRPGRHLDPGHTVE